MSEPAWVPLGAALDPAAYQTRSEKGAASGYAGLDGSARLLSANFSDWQTYVPGWSGTVTNPVIGNGTLTGRYAQLGKTVMGSIFLSTGSTTTYGSGTWSWTLPFGAQGNLVIGGNGYLNISGSAFVGFPQTAGGATFYIMSPTGVAWSPTSPATWVAGSGMRFAFFYETS